MPRIDRIEVGLLPSDDGPAHEPLALDDHLPALERALVDRIDAHKVGAIWTATVPEAVTSACGVDEGVDHRRQGFDRHATVVPVPHYAGSAGTTVLSFDARR